MIFMDGRLGTVDGSAQHRIPSTKYRNSLRPNDQLPQLESIIWSIDLKFQL